MGGGAFDSVYYVWAILTYVVCLFSIVTVLKKVSCAAAVQLTFLFC